MGTTEQLLLEMIEKSQFGKATGPDDYWYSYPNQKILAFQLARDLVVSGEPVDDSIELAKTFIDTFYLKAMRSGSWER